MLMEDSRTEVINYAKAMARYPLTVGTSGNVSLREGDRIAITPSGADYGKLTPGMITILDLKGNVVEGEWSPSSEVEMHLLIYRETDAAAVLHTHPLYATALGLVADETPKVHYMLGLCGGPVRVADYATFGTRELAENMRAAMADRSAVLLRNHGATCWGRTLEEAFTKTLYLEWCCHLWLVAKSAGNPRLIPDDAFSDALVRIGEYGEHRIAKHS